MSPHRVKDPVMKGTRPSYSNGFHSGDQQSDSYEDGPVYLMEHLATFSVGPQFLLETPKDGLRRLFQMEKSSGIWTQKMQIKLDRRWLVIIDYENGDIVEKFPMNLISDPTEFTSDDPKELYNNIVIFIVLADLKYKDGTPSEIHIFQSLQASAKDIVTDMKLFMTGKWKTAYRSERRSIPPPPSNPLPEPPQNGINVREQINLFNAAVKAHGSGPAVSHSSSSPRDQLEQVDHVRSTMSRDSNDETSSTTSERYERDVTTLNHCFDDIERFIARLQHAAAAFKELERRQKNRKSKKKDLGDGMLSMRAKPPPEREFLDILKKFKLSFNLLARLRNHIHDPNAPELVHFLFTPLTVIVEAARDSNYGPNIAAKVVTPLLTEEATDLLQNCCTSKENDLWHSLGDTWTVPREQWKGYEGNFHPVFSDGWTPENAFLEERVRSELNGPAVSSSIQRIHNQELRQTTEEFRRPEGFSSSHQDRPREGGYFYRGERDQQPTAPDIHPSTFDNRHYEPRHLSVPERNEQDFRGSRSDTSADSVEQGQDPHRQFDIQQQRWLEELKAAGAKIVVVLYPRTANNDKELSVVRGEVLEVVDDSRKWWRARNHLQQVGHVPNTIVTPYQAVIREEEVINNPLYTRTGPAREDYNIQGEHIEGRDRREEIYPGSSLHKGPQGPLPAPASADWIQRERRDTDINSSPITEEQNSREGDADKIPPSSLWKVPKAPSEQKDNSSMPPGALNPSVKQSNNMKIHKKKAKSPTPLHQNNKVQPPTPPPLPPTPLTQPWKPLIVKKINVSVPKDAHDRLKKEVTDQMTLGHGAHRKWGKVNLSYQDGLNITTKSSAAEVQEWLKSKDFSPSIRNLFDDITGKMMFKFTRSRLEDVLGNEEGSRLHSHLTVQKNISGFKTYSTRELQTILAERRRKIENSADSRDTINKNISLFNGHGHNSDSGVSSNGSDSDLSNTGFDPEGKIAAPSRGNKQKQKETYEWQRRQLLAQAKSN